MSEDQAKKNEAMSGKDIPTRRVVLSDQNQLPSTYSTTPGGTWFSTTPGGTRIIYERNFLLQCRNSPLAKSPPANLPVIPGVTCEEEKAAESSVQENGHETIKPKPKERGAGDEPQFAMDI